MGSDGLLDSGMVESTEFSEILGQSDQPIDVVNKVCTLILRRMGTLRAKPDNLTMLLLRVKDPKNPVISGPRIGLSLATTLFSGRKSRGFWGL